MLQLQFYSTHVVEHHSNSVSYQYWNVTSQ